MIHAESPVYSRKDPELAERVSNGFKDHYDDGSAYCKTKLTLT